MNDKKKLILSAIFLVIGVSAISQYYNYSGVKMSASWSTYYESLTDLNNAIGLDQEFPTAYLCRALVFKMMGKETEAQQDEDYAQYLLSNIEK